MSEFYTLIDFWCLPTLDFKSSVKLVSLGLMMTIGATLIALYIHPNRMNDAIKAVVTTLIIAAVSVIAFAMYMSSYKCEVILDDGSKRVEKTVVAHRYPQLNMPTVIIPRENRLPLMNRLYSSADRKDPSNTDER